MDKRRKYYRWVVPKKYWIEQSFSSNITSGKHYFLYGSLYSWDKPFIICNDGEIFEYDFMAKRELLSKNSKFETLIKKQIYFK